MTLLCRECGEEMLIDEHGISNHIIEGLVDHDKDADHVAVAEELNQAD
jgi:hypothetical protein